MSRTKEVILATPEDWGSWISLVRTRATKSRIWDLVNPSLTEKPVALEDPEVPEYDIPEDGKDFDHEAFKAQTRVYKMRLAEFERQNESSGDHISCIQDTIPIHNLIFFLETEEPHPWNILRAVKRRFGPCDEPRINFVERCLGHYLLEKNFRTHSEELFPEGVKIGNQGECQQKPMLETLHNIPNLDSISSITEIESDKKELDFNYTTYRD